MQSRDFGNIHKNIKMSKLNILLAIVVTILFINPLKADSWKSDTLKVVKQDGEMVFIILKNIESKSEVRSLDLSKIISSVEKNKDKIGNGPVVVQGANKSYNLKANGDYYFLSAFSSNSNDKFTVRIFENTTREQLEAYKANAASEGITISYNDLQIVNGKITALSMMVDCNDGYSGNLSITDIPESGVGFIRDYSEDAENPFEIGKIFDQDDANNNWMSDDDSDEYSYSFNKENNVSKKKKKGINYNHDFEFMLGLNNYLTADNQLPDNNNADYSIDPITSWTYGLNSVHEVAFSPFFKSSFQFGLQWYNFAMADPKFQIIENGERVDFIDRSPTFDATRSKLNITYLNAGILPVFKFGKKNDAFRIGAGVYGGYRIGSKSKFKYEDDGKDVIKDNFHLNSLRYGIKAQIGWKGVDLFATYDLNSLYIENRGPELNAFSFGLIF